MARPLFEGAKGYVAVVYGDHPLLRSGQFRRHLARLDAGLDAAILGFRPADPTGYGRFITEGDRLLAIREHKDATEAERRSGSAMPASWPSAPMRSAVRDRQGRNQERARASTT